MKGWRAVASLAPAMLLAVTGCHKAKIRAYNPATAPTTTTSTTSTTARAATSRTGGASASAGPRSSGRATMPAASAGATVHGKPSSTEVGMASWYGPPYHNRKGADGTVFDENAMTAAHRTLPMGSMVRVTNLATNESTVVRITDRGPFVDGRIIDLSLAAAKATGLYQMGVAKVRVEAFVPPASDPAGRWCVQIGVFVDELDAIQLKNDLLRRYTTAKVIEFTGPTGHWVRISPQQADKAHAAEIAETIHIPDPGAQPYLVRLN